MPATDIIEFVLYVTPGFVAIQVYRGWYPVRQVGDFAQVCWSIVYGVVIFALVKFLDERLLNYALNSNASGFPNPTFLLSLFVGGLVTGMLRIGIDLLRFRISARYKALSKLAPDPQSIWAKVNHQLPDEWVVVFLDDGAIYLGYIRSYRFDPDEDNQDFLLAKAKCVNEDLAVKYEVAGAGVYLNTRNVKRIEFVGAQE